MSLQVINVPSLHNGVSQQPPQMRSPDQSEAQENAWSSLADGLVKRPPTERIAKLANAPAANVHIHSINRDTNERYTVVVSSTGLKVFDEDGAEIAVEAPAGWGYLDGIEDYRTDLTMTSVADYTFIVNRRKTVAQRAVGAPPPVGESDYVPPRTPGGPPAWKDPDDPVTP